METRKAVNSADENASANTLSSYLRQSKSGAAGASGVTEKIHGGNPVQAKKAPLGDVTNRPVGEPRQSLKRSATDAALDVGASSSAPAPKRTSSQTRLTDGGYVQDLQAVGQSEDTAQDDVEVVRRSVTGRVLPEGVVDIDAPSAHIPHKVTEYVHDIHDLLMSREAEFAVSDYLANSELNAQMREILIDWLVEVAEEYHLKSETLYLSVRIIDRFLERALVSRTKLQLVGVTAMLIASKYEEIYAPSIEEFVFITDNTYMRDQVLRMERRILNTLKFCLSMPTIKNFLRRYVTVSGGNAREIMYTNYLAELTLTEYPFVFLRPSVIAASCVAIARATCGREPWTQTCEFYSGLNVDDIKEACTLVYKLSEAAPHKALQAIPDKYSRVKFNAASSVKAVHPFPEALAGASTGDAAVVIDLSGADDDDM